VGCLIHELEHLAEGKNALFMFNIGLGILELIAAFCALYLSRFEANQMKIQRKKEVGLMHWEKHELMAQKLTEGGKA
jgi:hypothetical protein